MGYQSAYEQYKWGALPEKDWQLARHILRTFWLFEGKAKNETWEAMLAGRFFNDDFMAELEGLREKALDHRRELNEKGLDL